MYYKSSSFSICVTNSKKDPYKKNVVRYGHDCVKWSDRTLIDYVDPLFDIIHKIPIFRTDILPKHIFLTLESNSKKRAVLPHTDFSTHPVHLRRAVPQNDFRSQRSAAKQVRVVLGPRPFVQRCPPPPRVRIIPSTHAATGRWLVSGRDGARKLPSRPDRPAAMGRRPARHTRLDPRTRSIWSSEP